MNMQKFYDTYNLCKERFASVCGVSKQSILKYEKDDISLRNDTKHKIEKTIRVIEKYKLKHPQIDHNFSSFMCGFSYQYNIRRHEKYKTKVRTLCEEES